VLAVDTQPVAEHSMAQGHSGKKVGEIIHAARAAAIAQHLQTQGEPHV
jgi:tRNA nucleotidyltransferase (CCA-adding enzyme)